MSWGKIGARRMVSTLPYDAEVEWLESDGSSWIGPGVLLEPNFIVEVTYTTFKSTSYYMSELAGGYSWSQSYLRLISSWTNRGTINQGSVSTPSANYSQTTGTDSPQTHTLYANPASGVSLDGSAIYQGTFTGVASGSVPYFVIFGTGGTSASSPFSVSAAGTRIHSCILRSPTATILDIIPVRIGGTGYMYDRVSKTLFGNSGTGAFIVGPDKIA